MGCAALRVLLPAAALCALPGSPSLAAPEQDVLEVRTETLRVRVAPDAPVLRSIEALAVGRPAHFRFGDELSPAAWLETEPPFPGPYEVRREDRDDEIVLRFASRPDARGVRVEHVWTIGRRDHRLSVTLRARGAGRPSSVRAQLHLAGAQTFEVEPAPGFGGLSERVRAVVIDGDGACEVAAGRTDLGAGEWAGLRNRFWALLAQPDPAGASFEAGAAPALVQPGSRSSLHLEMYAGPISRRWLGRVDPKLPALWLGDRSAIVRLPALGMSWLLDDLLMRGVSAGIAVIVLAIAVKLLLSPLTRLAERWQREVNSARTRLRPALAEVRAHYRGAERSRRLLEVHREHRVHPLFGLKSALGVIIQVPVFLAAYHMLDESVGLSGASFLWIGDLSRPDRAGALPRALPLLGDGINALPLVMTAATVLASRLHDDGSLAGDLLVRQRWGLYAMAAGFLLLFYTFPAAMVLYWTTGNLVSVGRALSARARHAAQRIGSRNVVSP